MITFVPYVPYLREGRNYQIIDRIELSTTETIIAKILLILIIIIFCIIIWREMLKDY